MNTFANCDPNAPLPIAICANRPGRARTLRPLPANAPSLAEVLSALFAALRDADAHHAMKHDECKPESSVYDAKQAMERLQTALQVLNEYVL